MIAPDSTWTPERVKELLQADDKAVGRAMVALFERQTSDEQASESTKHHNKRGFSAFDAGAGSYFAKWVMSGRQLTGRHLDKARRVALRYVKQLSSIAAQRTEVAHV